MIEKHKSKFCEYCGNPLERFLSVINCAKLCDQSPEFFRKLIRKREIGFVRIGGNVRIPVSELVKIITVVPSLEDEVNALLSN